VADHITLQFIGGDEFIADLRRWRTRLRRQCAAAARDESEGIASAMQHQWPQGKTGNLRRGIRSRLQAESPDLFVYRARAGAPHSNLYNFGTKPRRTKQGWNRGTMPAHPTWIQTAILFRRRFARAVMRILASPEPAIGPGSPDVVVTPGGFGGRGLL
jgi:hypothetical protein